MYIMLTLPGVKSHVLHEGYLVTPSTHTERRTNFAPVHQRCRTGWRVRLIAPAPLIDDHRPPPHTPTPIVRGLS